MENSQTGTSSLHNLSPSLATINIRAEQTRHLYSNVTTAIIANTGIAILLMWILKDRVNQTNLLYWGSALAIVLFARGLGLYFFKKLSPGDEEINNWLYGYAIKSTLTAMIWGLSIWLFQPYNDLETPVLITFALGGMTAGAAAILGSVITIYFLYVLFCMLPIIIWFFLQSSDTHYIMATMLCIYSLAMISGGLTYKKVMLKSILLSKQLITAKEQAEQANQSKSIFLSRMSHELRTPLNAIMGFTQLLLNNENQTESQKNHTEEIYKASHLLLKLIEDLLDLSRIEANRLELHINKTNYQKLINECIDYVRPLATQLNISIDFEPDIPDNIYVLADEIRLQQILLNLVSNACKYNRTDGTITIKLQLMKNHQIRMSVIDTGIGIAAEKQDKVFQSYQRLGHEDSLIEGTGLGLAIVKQLVELMNGKIDFTSKKGEGSTFWVDLPVA
ncbi:MAG: HAMP domain-containing histidine kinase [Gammaproteobacteria bacterium]|nr:HAMP domain-containing histidine kinase [Gammaproteobacteria bacterium]MDH5735382.1 HAMP domain-containing histidine kinase [Gammaproteobacteria bacterium]